MIKLKTLKQFEVTPIDFKTSDKKIRNIFFENIELKYRLDTKDYEVTFKKYYEDTTTTQVEEIIDGVLTGNQISHDVVTKVYIPSKSNIVSNSAFEAVKTYLMTQNPAITDSADLWELMGTQGIITFIAQGGFYGGELTPADFEIIKD